MTEDGNQKPGKEIKTKMRKAHMEQRELQKRKDGTPPVPLHPQVEREG